MIPEEEPDSSEPRPFTAGFAIMLPLLAAYLLFVAVLVMLQLTESEPPGSFPPALLGIAMILAYGAAFILAVPRIPQPPAKALGFVPAPRISWTAALTLLPSILLISELDNLFRAIWPSPEVTQAPIDGPPTGLRLVQVAVVWIAVMPVVQEIFYRGLLQPRVVELWGRRRGVLAAAGLAAVTGPGLVTSLDPRVLPTALGSALVLGMLRESSGSVLPGLMLNMLFGVTLVLAVLGTFGIPGFDDTTAPHTPLHWLALGAVGTGVGLGLCRATWQARMALEDLPPPEEL